MRNILLLFCIIILSACSHSEEKEVIKRIEDHRTEMEKVIPEEMKIYADIIFNHHLMHYKAELSWAEESIDAIGKERSRL